MVEIWKASHDPLHWQSVAGSSIVGGWWAFYLIPNICQSIGRLLLTSAQSAEDTQIGLGVAILSNVLHIVSAVLAIKLVTTIVRAQSDYVANRS
jgi:hypothetical protein